MFRLANAEADMREAGSRRDVFEKRAQLFERIGAEGSRVADSLGGSGLIEEGAQRGTTAHAVLRAFAQCPAPMSRQATGSGGGTAAAAGKGL